MRSPRWKSCLTSPGSAPTRLRAIEGLRDRLTCTAPRSRRSIIVRSLGGRRRLAFVAGAAAASQLSGDTPSVRAPAPSVHAVDRRRAPRRRSRPRERTHRYVSPSGSDRASGSKAHPWRTVTPRRAPRAAGDDRARRAGPLRRRGPDHPRAARTGGPCASSPSGGGAPGSRASSRGAGSRWSLILGDNVVVRGLRRQRPRAATGPAGIEASGSHGALDRQPRARHLDAVPAAGQRRRRHRDRQRDRRLPHPRRARRAQRDLQRRRRAAGRPLPARARDLRRGAGRDDRQQHHLRCGRGRHHELARRPRPHDRQQPLDRQRRQRDPHRLRRQRRVARQHRQHHRQQHRHPQRAVGHQREQRRRAPRRAATATSTTSSSATGSPARSASASPTPRCPGRSPPTPGSPASRSSSTT